MYKKGIINAIKELEDGTGVSGQAIKNNIKLWNPTIVTWYNGVFERALKNLVDNGRLVQLGDSYRLTHNSKERPYDDGQFWCDACHERKQWALHSGNGHCNICSRFTYIEADKYM